MTRIKYSSNLEIPRSQEFLGSAILENIFANGITPTAVDFRFSIDFELSIRDRIYIKFPPIRAGIALNFSALS